MKSIVTLTLNPTIDVAYEVPRVRPTHKMRTVGEHYDPGGGGINVARVFARLGGNVRCVYLSGGATGVALDGLLDQHQLLRSEIAIAGHTRVSASVLEQESGTEFRFVPPGPTVAPEEWRACLDRLDEVHGDMMVLSGSLPPGAPGDAYAQVTARMRKRGIPVVLDSSGPGLAGGIAGGGLLLVKPSLGEMRQLSEEALEDEVAVTRAALALVKRGASENVAVTMGHRGAILAGRDGALHLPAVPVEAKSSVGAGDSFLAGMVFALGRGEDMAEAFRFGIAAGAAAVLTPGTSLAYPEDIARMRALVTS